MEYLSPKIWHRNDTFVLPIFKPLFSEWLITLLYDVERTPHTPTTQKYKIKFKLKLHKTEKHKIPYYAKEMLNQEAHAALGAESLHQRQ